MAQTPQSADPLAEQKALWAQIESVKNDLAKYNKGGTSSVEDFRRRQAAVTTLTNKGMMLQNQLQVMQQNASQQAGVDQNNKAKQDAEDAKNKILGLAQGGVDRLNNDPTDKVFRDYLQQQMGGKVLDENGKPFANGAPQFDAKTGEASTYNAAQMGAAKTNASTYDPSSYQSQNMQAQSVNYKDPFDAQTIGAMVNDQAAGAGAAEASRNQLMRDAALANGGNAFDPSLAAAQSESMSERQRSVANSRNQINMVANRENAATQNAASMANAGFAQQAGQFNAANANQAGQFNANAANQAGQYNAGARQSADSQNAGFQQQANQYNAGAQNQAGQYNAGARQGASFQNAGMQNQAGMFNVGNQMSAQNANFQAGQQSQMYNQGQRTQAAGQLGSYNNQRQGMVSDAEGRQIDVIGRQTFRGPETGLPQAQQPNFQQWQAGGGSSRVIYAPGYSQQPQQQAVAKPLTGSVWAGSGRPSVGSGFTTSTFGPTQVGKPWGPGTQVGTNQPAVNGGIVKPAGKPADDRRYNPNQAKLPGVKIISDPRDY